MQAPISDSPPYGDLSHGTGCWKKRHTQKSATPFRHPGLETIAQEVELDAGKVLLVVSWLLRLTYLAEFARMRALARSHPDLAARGRLFPRF